MRREKMGYLEDLEDLKKELGLKDKSFSDLYQKYKSKKHLSNQLRKEN